MMNGALSQFLLATGPEETALRFKALPPLWLVFMVLLPVTIGVIWWIYRRESATAGRKPRRLLAAIRIAAVLLVMLLLFQPYAETSLKRLVKSHLVVLLDTSASMEFEDTYTDPGKAQRMQQAVRRIHNLRRMLAELAEHSGRSVGARLDLDYPAVAQVDIHPAAAGTYSADARPHFRCR